MPDLDVNEYFKKIKEHHFYPISTSLMGDFETPLSLFAKLDGDFLLESVEKVSTIGRYSFIGKEVRETIKLGTDYLEWVSNSRDYEKTFFSWKIDPSKTVSVPSIHLNVIGEKKRRLNFENIQPYLSLKEEEKDDLTKHPLLPLRQYYLNSKKVPIKERHSPFIGGLVGCLSFDAVKLFEPFPATKDVLHVPLGTMISPRFVIAYDNFTRKMSLTYLIASPYFSYSISDSPQKTMDMAREVIDKWMVKKCSEKGVEKTKAFINTKNRKVFSAKLIEDARKQVEDQAKFRLEHGLKQLEVIKKKVLQPFVYKKKGSKTIANQLKNCYKEKKGNHSQAKYVSMVEACVEHIKKGDAFQIVPSIRFSFPMEANPLEVYRSLRMKNPSPYMYYLNFSDFQLVGSSPEVMVKVENEKVKLRPIAGTRKRGVNSKEDKQLEEELLADKKELAEHLMLIDLARNDLGRIAKTGSVKVKEKMVVEKYSHVQHIVSLVEAIKKKDKDVFDLIAATFPAGTLSGAPKVRACDIIAKLEKESRGPYGGMVFYLSFDGNFDSCITIRTLLVKDKKAYLQVGAGVVYDSVGEREYQECLDKAKAIFRSCEDAGERMANFL